MQCSKEEIERKRLAALQKLQNKISTQTNSSQKFNSHNDSNYRCEPRAGPYRSTPNRTFHPYSRVENNLSPNNNVDGRSDSIVIPNVAEEKVVSGTIYLISEDRFEVNPSEFSTPLINVFRTMSSRIYDAKSKLWNFSIDDYQEFVTKVGSLSPHVVLGPLPPYILKVLKEEPIDSSNVDLSPIEPTLRNKLLPFQQEGVRFGIARRGRCMIADDMGLGKTFQALAIANYYRHNWPLLIVTTSSMRETWQSKIHELMPSVPMRSVVTLSSSKDSSLVADKQTEIVIVSYKITSLHTDLLKNKKFGCVIIDESHYLKSAKAQCTVALRGICRGASRALLLSGTPALSRPQELYTQLAIIDHKFMPYNDYGKRYCAGKLTNYGWDMSGQSNLAELQIILQKKFLIRRTKEQVLTKLKEKTRDSVLLDDSLLQFSKQDEQDLSQMAEKYKTSSSSDRHSALITFFSESAKVKIPAVCKYIKQVVSDESEGKFLVFAHHRIVIEAVCEALDESRTPYVCIVGSTPTATRSVLVDRFQEQASCRCAVLSTTAAGAGLTLTAASLVVFAELHWNPGVLAQAEARAHRLGQPHAARVRYLLARRTADDLMWPLLQDKLQVLNNVGLSKDSYEDTTVRHQGSQCDISKYLLPSTSKNVNDFIPGTNVRKESAKISTSTNNNNNYDLYKSFIEDDEDDELLANLDL